MQIHPRQLEAFQQVMATGSMTMAAEMLKISQPAVSRLIRDLEATIGIRLFKREGNRLLAGTDAERLYREVTRFYVGMDAITQVALDLKSARVGNLRIASFSALGLTFLSRCIKKIKEDRPALNVTLNICLTQDVLELAAASQIDIGYVGATASEYPGVHILPPKKLDAVCIIPASHPLAKNSVIKIADLHDEPMIALDRYSPLQHRFDLALEAAGVVPRRELRTSFAYSACGMAACGLGLTISDPFTAKYYADPNIVVRPFEPNIPFEFSTVLPAHQPRSVILNDFMKRVQELVRSEFPDQAR
jgi:DNA-binding transcriptional LysR family regulator